MPYWIVVIGTVCAIMLAAFIPDYGLSQPLPLPMPAPSFFILALGGATLLGVFSRKHIPSASPASVVVVWAGFYLLLSGIGLLQAGLNAANLEIIKNRGYSIITLLGTFFLAQDARGRRMLIWGMGFVLLLDLVTIGWEMAVPGRFSQVFGRAAGFFLNPTIAGQGLAACMLVLWEEMPERLRGPAFLAVGVAILGTFSRGSMLGWLVLWVGGWVVGLWTVKRSWKSQALLLCLVALGVFLVQQGALDRLGWSALNANTLDRLRFDISDHSAQERMQIAQMAWQKVQQSPWWGHGLGVAVRVTSESTHNLFLSLWIDHGLAGLALLPLLLWPLRKSGPSGRLCLFYFLFFAFFTHNLLDERNFLIPIAILLARPKELLPQREES